jgi:hypothetical protein
MPRHTIRRALTGAGDKHHYRQDCDAPIVIPDNIAAVYLGNNQSLPVATLVGTYNQAVGDESAAV